MHIPKPLTHFKRMTLCQKRRNYGKTCISTTYLNNIVEQDHRFIKRLVNPGMGFGLFNTAPKCMELTKSKAVETCR